MSFSNLNYWQRKHVFDSMNGKTPHRGKMTPSWENEERAMETATIPRHLDTQYVQFFLDNLKPMQKFTVIFEKLDGTQRKITGYLDPNAPLSRKSAPPVITEDGWKSFKLDNVLFIDTVDSNTLNNDW